MLLVMRPSLLHMGTKGEQADLYALEDLLCHARRLHIHQAGPEEDLRRHHALATHPDNTPIRQGV